MRNQLKKKKKKKKVKLIDSHTDYLFELFKKIIDSTLS